MHKITLSFNSKTDAEQLFKRIQQYIGGGKPTAQSAEIIGLEVCDAEKVSIQYKNPQR